MNESAEMSLVAMMAWLHLAFLLVPLMIYTMKLEWEDYRHAHPRHVVRPQGLSPTPV